MSTSDAVSPTGHTVSPVTAASPVPVTAADPIATLHAWADGIRAHRPDDVAAAFTDDALFQGFDPTHTIGRAGIAAYYAKQPIGLHAAFDILERRPIGADAVLVYARVDFSPPEAPVIPVHLTAVLRRSAGAWLISHYHVSKIDPAVAGARQSGEPTD